MKPEQRCIYSAWAFVMKRSFVIMTDKQKEQIRKLRSKGVSYTDISKKLKIGLPDKSKLRLENNEK